ncbi:phosphotransferase [Streptomyces sp. NPDC051364]|uniref:phosphotransferase n=1 Tax=Streptomyces sp. NPDC051364 TaxID=3155799 RepID=UPI003422EFE9
MTFTKDYPGPEPAARAAAHHAWLERTGLPVPHLITLHARALEFEHVPGRHATPGDLPAIARLLGRAHTTAHHRHLSRVHLDHDLVLPDVGVLPSFTAARAARVRQLLETGAVPDPAFTTDQAVELIHSAATEPAAFYKDANPRNFLVTPGEITIVDFDDLTLAPFGYDLAKLLVTTAMTHGPLPAGLTTEALSAYNDTAAHPCTPERLADWMEIHHILTSPYTGRNGYAHSWHTLRPAERTP